MQTCLLCAAYAYIDFLIFYFTLSLWSAGMFHCAAGGEIHMHEKFRADILLDYYGDKVQQLYTVHFMCLLSKNY
jgi:hypothetical protein